MRKSGQSFDEHGIKILVWICGCVFLLLVTWVTVAFIRTMNFQRIAYPVMHDVIGLRLESPYNEEGEEIIVFYPAVDGYAYSQGLRPGDLDARKALENPELNQFSHKKLLENQGSSYTFDVARDGELISVTFEAVPEFPGVCDSNNFWKNWISGCP